MMKAIINVVLSICIVLLVYLCYDSLQGPLHFDKVRKQREEVVKRRLRDIRQAQMAYYELHGRHYTASWDTLTGFVQAAPDVSGLQRQQADSLRYIPYSQGKQFELQVLDKVGDSGLSYCLLEVCAPVETYLKGLDHREINEWRKKQEQQGRYAGLKIGSLVEPNNNAGNWE